MVVDYDKVGSRPEFFFRQTRSHNRISAFLFINRGYFKDAAIYAICIKKKKEKKVPWLSSQDHEWKIMMWLIWNHIVFFSIKYNFKIHVLIPELNNEHAAWTLDSGHSSSNPPKVNLITPRRIKSVLTTILLFDHYCMSKKSLANFIMES